MSNMNTKRLMQYQKHTVHETMWMSVHHELKMININFKNVQCSSIVTMWMSVHHELKMININFKNVQCSSIVTMWMSVHHELKIININFKNLQCSLIVKRNHVDVCPLKSKTIH